MGADEAQKEWDRLRAAHDAALSATNAEGIKAAWEALALAPAPDMGTVRYKLGELFYLVDRLCIDRSPDFGRKFAETVISDISRLAKAGAQ